MKFMRMGCTGLVALGASLAGWAEVDIDALCPPRPETSAAFTGVYPRAVRSYREAATMACAYMTALPAMTTLVETGVPEQRYQHNAYVSKTHAAHVLAMLDWSVNEPANREKGLRFARASADYLLTQLEPADAVLAYWPPTYGREPLEYDPAIDGPSKPSMVGNEPEGAVKYRGQVMLVYPASVGSAFVAMYRVTREQKYLAAAQGIAETYLRIRRADNSWPLKMWLATGETIGENTLVPTSVLTFFEALFDVTGAAKWRTAADETFGWIEAHPLTDWNWDGQFEDVQPQAPYQNPTKHNACDVLMYVLKRFPGDARWQATARKLLEFSEKRFVCWATPSNHPAWPAPSVLEQYSCFTPIDSSAAKMIRAYMALYAATSNAVDLAKAQALANTITRVQKASGRIPTFWDGTATDSGLSTPTYDWLNCMQASVQALLLVPEEPPREGLQCYVAPGATGDYTQGNPGGDLLHAAADLAVTDGDVIHLAAGTYDINGCVALKAGVRLVGAGPAATHVRRVVTGTNDRVMYVYGNGVEIRDLTLSGGYTIYQGGGIGSADRAEFLVSNCVVENCSAKYQGGGVFRGTLRDCVVRNCRVFGSAEQGEGGNANSYPPSLWERTGGGVFGGTYHDCTIVSNSAVYGGGGIGGSGGSALYASLALAETFVARAYNCTIAYNTALNGAGAFGGDVGSLYLTNCKIFQNRAATNVNGFGGGVYKGILSGCEVAENTSQYGGAGFGGSFTACLLRDNVTTYPGAACYNSTTCNCVVTGNSGGLFGVLTRGSHRGDLVYGNTCRERGVLCCESDGSDLVAVNCTIVSNRCTNGQTIGFTQGGITNCVVFGHASGDVKSVQAAVNCLFGAFDAQDASLAGAVDCQAGVEPGFRTVDGAWPFQLSSRSPGRNAACTLAWMATGTDLLGRPRVQQGAPDIGAYECDPTQTTMLLR